MKRALVVIFAVAVVITAFVFVMPVRAEMTKAVIHYAQQTGSTKHGTLVLGESVKDIRVDQPETGQVTVIAARGKSLDYKGLVNGMRRANYLVRCVQMTGTGKLIEIDGKPAFQVEGTNELFMLEKGECPGYHHKAHHGATLDDLISSAKTLSHKSFEVTGCVSETKGTKDKSAQRVLHVASFETK
jgi:hypothetical protein